MATGAVALSACTGPSPSPSVSPSMVGDISSIVVGQSDTQAPSLEYTPGLEYSDEQVEVLWDGEGEALTSGQSLLLDVYGESLDSSDVVINTFDGSPEPYILTPDSVGGALYDALLDAHVGARIMVVEPSEVIENAEGVEVGDGANVDNSAEGEAPPVALVVDVRSEHAVGAAQPAPKTMPEVVVGDGGVPRVVVDPEAPPVTDLQVATLIKGVGPQITPSSRALINYTMFYYADGEIEGEDSPESWSAGDVFDTTWDVDRAPYLLDMASGSVVTGLSQGLLDQTEGSQVELLVPGAMGYPSRGTMVIVVDILDVWNSET